MNRFVQFLTTRAGPPGILIITVLAAVTIAGCDSSGTDSEDMADDSAEQTGLTRGFAFSPPGFPDDFSRTPEFFDEMQGLGRGSVLSNSLWRDDQAGGTDAGQIPQVAELVAGQADDHEFEPVTVFGWHSGDNVFISVPENATNDWTNTEAVAKFSSMVKQFVDRYEPTYLFLGNETDFYAEQDPEGYDLWLDAYRQIRTAAKQAHPTTRVGTVFNVEHMMGWGKFSNWTTSQQQAFSMHDPSTLDVVGLTVYPYLGIPIPDDVPATYLDPVFNLIGNIPVVITETGWPAASPGGTTPWTPGESEQVTFASRLEAMISGENVLAAHWLFLHPITSGRPASEILTFGTVSVRRADGSKRPVYDVWAAFN